MSLKFTEENNAASWDGFLTENSGDFLQSWAWGEMQKAEASQPKRYNISRNNAQIGAFLAYKQKTRLGEYGYIPRGPVLENGQSLSPAEQKEFANFLKNIFPGCFFVLCEPPENSVFSDFPKFSNLQPEKTLVIDLTTPEEELYRKIKNSRRQGIIIAEKNNVKITHSGFGEYFEIFSALIRKTGARQGFGIFDSEHYKNILKFMPAEIFAAKTGNTVTAAALVIFWGDTATYLHAGSDDAHKQLRSPDLVIWELIKESKNRGFKKFDFWGIDKKRWPGVTFFKKSFGGEEISYGKARTVIINRPKFLLYNLYRNLRKML